MHSLKEWPKIVKTTIGTLINLSNNEPIRESLCEMAPYITAIFELFALYQGSAPIIDYLLKLIVNTTKNSDIVFAFSTEEFFVYLLLFLETYIENEEIIFYSLKLLRIVTMNSELLKRSGNTMLRTKLAAVLRIVRKNGKT